MDKIEKDADFRWADADQASNRLRDSYVLYGNDVFYVAEIRRGHDGLMVYGTIMKSGKNAEFPIYDEFFHGFRKLPPLGWINLAKVPEPTAVFTRRIPQRSNGHGLRDNRVSVQEMREGALSRSPRFGYNAIVKDPGYEDMILGNFPSASEIIERLKTPSVVAFSKRYAIRRTILGEFYLYRNADLVGAIGNGEVVVPKTTSWCKEELAEVVPEEELKIVVR